jgi:hypothetical protein
VSDVPPLFFRRAEYTRVASRWLATGPLIVDEEAAWFLVRLCVGKRGEGWLSRLGSPGLPLLAASCALFGAPLDPDGVPYEPLETLQAVWPANTVMAAEIEPCRGWFALRKKELTEVSFGTLSELRFRWSGGAVVVRPLGREEAVAKFMARSGYPWRG